MTAPDLAAEAAELREIIASLRRETDELAAKLSAALSATDWMIDTLLAARRAGYMEGLAAAGPQPRGQRSTAALHSLPGGKTVRKARPGREGDAS